MQNPNDDAAVQAEPSDEEALDFSEETFEPDPDESLGTGVDGDERLTQYFRHRHRELMRRYGGDRAKATNELAAKSGAGVSTLNNYLSDKPNPKTQKPWRVSLTMLHRLAPALNFETRGALLTAVDDWYSHEYAITPRSLCRRENWAVACRRFLEGYRLRDASRSELLAARDWLRRLGRMAEGGAPNPMTVDFLWERWEYDRRMDR